MLKATAAYKMSKSGKIYLANTRSQPNRRYRHAMVVLSELEAAAANSRRTKGDRSADTKAD